MGFLLVRNDETRIDYVLLAILGMTGTAAGFRLIV